MVQYSRRTLLSPISTPDAGSASGALRQLSDCPEGAPPAKTLSSPTFTVSPSLLRAAAIGKCQARGLAQVSVKKARGLNPRAELVLSALRSALRIDREK